MYASKSNAVQRDLFKLGLLKPATGKRRYCHGRRRFRHRDWELPVTPISLVSSYQADHIARSSTFSITSSVAERLEENGRTYHAYKEGKYMLPNDEAELNRLGHTSPFGSP
jgi:hypothetical protein